MNKLPPETLTRCFLYLIPWFPLTLGPSKVRHDCIRLAHVCKYWREVAFGFSGLWDRIEFTRPKILKLYLDLSRSRPLEVCIQHIGSKFGRLGPAPCGDAMLGHLIPVRSRIGTLIIHKNWIPPHPCPFMGCSLPELETLSITSNIGWENESQNKPKTRLRALFQNRLPRLRRLFIPEYTPWPNNDFKDLTLLCLYNQSALEEELPQLLQMLRRSPNLEELYLRQHEYSRSIDDPPPNLGPTFPAHSLRKLRLHNFSNEATVCILSTMRLQPNGVAVHISDTVMTPDTFAEIFPLFPPGFTLGSAEKLEVHHNPEGPFGIVFCGTECSLKIGGCLSWYGEEDKTDAAISLLGYIYQECAQTLRELWFYDYSGSKEEGEYAFANFSCTNLEKLVLVATASGDVSGRLWDALDPGNSEIQDLPAPRLRSLAVREIYAQSELEQLIAFCERRSKMGHPLHEVSVSPGQGGVPEWMPRLCGSSSTPISLVAREGWDGMELPSMCRDYEGPWWPSWGEPIDDWCYNS